MTTDHNSDAFAERVRSLKVPEPSADREALLLKLGYGGMVVGLILIGVAWYQASGTDQVWEQIPYLISAGLTGMALVFLSVGLVLRYSLARLFRYWLARLVYEHQVQTDREVEVLERIEQLLAQRPPTDQ